MKREQLSENRRAKIIMKFKRTERNFIERERG